MNKAGVALLLAFVAASLIYEASAKNSICVNANTEIVRMYCDGEEVNRHKMPYRGIANKCDCWEMKVCKNITIRAKGVFDGGQSQSGVGICQTTQPEPYQNWRCIRSQNVRGWHNQAHLRTNNWPEAEYAPRAKKCHMVKKQACMPSQMFWNVGNDAKSVDCILKLCGDECQRCQKTGPGKCDPGMCTYGKGVNAITLKERCNRRCRVDWKAWTKGYKGDGYIRITDLKSGSHEIFRAYKAGYYLAEIDMDQCTFTKKIYGKFTLKDWLATGERAGKSVLNLDSYNPSMKNIVAAELAVGQEAPDPDKLNYDLAPLKALYTLGSGGISRLIALNRYCTMSAVLTGFQYGPVAVSDPHHTGVDDFNVVCP